MTKTSLLSVAALTGLLLAAPADAQRGRRLTRLPPDTVALSQQVMARMTNSLLEKDLRRIMALTVPRERRSDAPPARPVLNRDPLLDGSPFVRDAFSGARTPIPGTTPIEQATFTESLSGTGTFDNSTLTFAGAGSGSRLGFRPGQLDGTLTGQVLVADPSQRASFIGSNPGSSTGPFSASVVGSGYRVGDALFSDNAQMAVTGLAGGNLPGSVSIPLSSRNFRIDGRGFSAGDFTNSVSVPGRSNGLPTVIDGTFNVQYGTTPR